MQNVTAKSRPPIKIILLAWFVAGTLDMLGAILVYTVIMKKLSAEKLVRGIASGVFKKEAFSGGTEMIFMELFFITSLLLRLPFFTLSSFLTYLFLESKKYPVVYCMGFLFG